MITKLFNYFFPKKTDPKLLHYMNMVEELKAINNYTLFQLEEARNTITQLKHQAKYDKIRSTQESVLPPKPRKKRKSKKSKSNVTHPINLLNGAGEQPNVTIN